MGPLLTNESLYIYYCYVRLAIRSVVDVCELPNRKKKMDIMYWLLNLLVLSQVQQVNSRLVEFSGVAGNSATAVAVSNTALLNMTLAKLRPGDTLHIPNKTYWMMGGIRASGLESVTIQLDGTLSFSKDIKAWPASKPGSKMPQTCIQIENTVRALEQCPIVFYFTIIIISCA